MKPLILFSLLWLFPFNIAGKDELTCFWACDSPLYYISFAGIAPDPDYYAWESKVIESGFKELNHECEEYGAVTLLPWSIIDNVTLDDEAKLVQIGYDDLTIGGNTEPQNYTTIVVLDNELFALSLRTSLAWDRSEVTRAEYGYAMYGFWGIVLFVGFVNRVYILITNRRQQQQNTAAKTKKKSTVELRSKSRSLRLWTKKNITVPPLISYHASQPFGWCTIPPRLQSITVMAFFIINLVLCCVSYELFAKNLYWKSPRTQLWRYLADRTGCIAIANMPLIWAFAMRNNVLIWLTGWSFSTFNQFHRWVSRIATIEAIIHSVGYTVETFAEGGKAEYNAEWAERFWWMGAIATIVMCFLCGFSIYPMRKLMYEVFLIVHIGLAILFVIAIYYHVEIFEGQYNPYIWPCVALWVFDRFLRICRVAYLSFPTFKGIASYNPSSNIIRVHVPVRSHFQQKPGTYYYLYMLNGLKFWESHPFTLSDWEDIRAEGNEAHKHGTTCTFVVRPYDSFTRRLRDRIVRNVDDENDNRQSGTPIRIAIEGPYGTGHDLKHHDSALFVIGGSGITVALGHVRALCQAVNGSETLQLRSVHLVWAVREWAQFQDVFDREISSSWLNEAGLVSEVAVQIDVYVTRRGAGCITPPEGTPELHEIKSDGVRVSQLAKVHPNVHVFEQRPDVREIIMDRAESYATGGQKMAVVCCGPSGLADDARGGIVAGLAKGYDGVDYFPESFNW